VQAELESVIRSAIVGAPLARLLGLELVAAAPDRVQVRLPFRPEATTVGDLVHGGALAALVDTTATAAAWSGADLARGPRGTTVSLAVSYLAGARGRDLIATGTVIRRGRSIVFCEVTVADPDQTEVMRAQVTYKLDHRDPAPL
jgi:uncharacterized protein (TIGR00369 family)